VLTRFSTTQLDDPDTRSAHEVIRSCVHCGFCTATCPTYVLLGDELDGPRGRIYLIKEMLERGAVPDAATVTHLDRCLSCLGCMTTCPSGVNYMHLIDHARAYVEQHYHRPWRQRVLRTWLSRILTSRALLRTHLRVARWLRPLAAALPTTLRPMLRLAPARLPSPGTEERGGVWPALGPRRGRVALLAGCVQAVLAPRISAAAVRVLTRAGYDVVVLPQAQCCGSLPHHLGQQESARQLARRSIDAWSAEAERGGLDAIVVTTSGCGTSLKDYGFLFREDARYAAPAARVSALTRDISELLSDCLPATTLPNGSALTVAYHPPCSLQHGQGLHGIGEKLLERAGFVVRAIAEGHLCCGSAGTYNLLQPELASQLLERKLAQVQRLSPDVIATGNIGCITQLASGTAVPVVHTVELLDWATGGPAPPELAAAPIMARHAGSSSRRPDSR
jgi:glycolate oxidase iron-sulfur subunit